MNVITCHVGFFVSTPSRQLITIDSITLRHRIDEMSETTSAVHGKKVTACQAVYDQVRASFFIIGFIQQISGLFSAHISYDCMFVIVPRISDRCHDPTIRQTAEKI
jgi:hypothetical protein